MRVFQMKFMVWRKVYKDLYGSVGEESPADIDEYLEEHYGLRCLDDGFTMSNSTEFNYEICDEALFMMFKLRYL